MDFTIIVHSTGYFLEWDSMSRSLVMDLLSLKQLCIMILFSNGQVSQLLITTFLSTL